MELYVELPLLLEMILFSAEAHLLTVVGFYEGGSIMTIGGGGVITMFPAKILDQLNYDFKAATNTSRLGVKIEDASICHKKVLSDQSHGTSPSN